jgi:hypothetical protein
MDLNLGRMRQNGSMTTLGPYFRSKSPGHSPAAELPFGSTVLTQRDLSWRCQMREVPQLLPFPFCLFLPDGLVRFAPDPGRRSRAKGWIIVFGELEHAASRQGKSRVPSRSLFIKTPGFCSRMHGSTVERDGNTSSREKSAYRAVGCCE